jgi:glycosyltransferase involved in cell wall biosynthesis
VSLTTSAQKKKHIVCIARTFGFPNGMAPTQRLRLMARALVEQSVAVTVLIMWVSESPQLIENTRVRGEWHGVHFEYTTGTTIRSPHFFVRRWVEMLGIVRALCCVFRLSRHQGIDSLYLYDASMHITMAYWLFVVLARLINVPVAIELNERPWSLKPNSWVIERRTSPLLGVRGAIVISDFLNEWVNAESSRRGRSVTVLQMPILVDVNEVSPRDTFSETPTVLYAASPAYEESFAFILEAMEEVWRVLPSYRLVVTGRHPILCAHSGTLCEPEKRGALGPVEQAGYLTRPELLRRYTEASALLVPLFDDIRSKARFPTKIGEYLTSGRPVITNRVGQVARYFEDGVNAFVCDPGDARLYGQTILRALQDPIRASQVGVAGRRLAERCFHYANYGEALARFFDSLV